MRKFLGPPVGKWIAVEENRLARWKNKQDLKMLEESAADRKARLRREKVQTRSQTKEDTPAAQAEEAPKASTDAKPAADPKAATKPKADFLAGTVATAKSAPKSSAGKKKKKK